LALSGLKGEIEGAPEFRLEFYDVLLSTYLTYLTVGAYVIFVLKVSISRRWPSVLHTSVFAILLAIYLVLGEASIGARRFVLLILILAIVGASRAWNMPAKHLMVTLSKMGLAAMLLAIVFSVYFQTVRFNLLQPEIAISLSSGNIGEMVRGGLSALIPNVDFDTEMEQPAMLRPGPFELIYDVLASEFTTQATTHGHITRSSTQAMIPYIIAGTDKESVSVDKTLVDELGIIPFDGFIDGIEIIDLPSSLLAIFIADYGLPGSVLAPMITTAGLVLISLITKCTGQSTLLTILAVSVCFQIIGNVEGDLLTVLTVLRDFALSILVITGAIKIAQLINKSFRPALRYARQ
jgi:hypothetical protein